MKITLVIIFLLLFKINIADEGFWLPLFLEDVNEAGMKSMGFNLSAKDIYDTNQSSMKDAVVRFGRGCTGSIISSEGLLITNHHCGYGQIQRLTTLENDYLTYGFWAGNKKEELQCPGLTVSILAYMKDVTDDVLKNVSNNLTLNQRDSLINLNIKEIIDSEYTRNEKTKNNYDISILPFYYGNQFILMTYEIFKDIRLVGAPPSSIGKFGGDTDNWMWPRHTGDFAYFRIYADENNLPAKYSARNIPYTPKYSFTISIKGVEKNDFTMVLGYPGTTTQYITSYGVELITKYENPIAIEMREKRISIFEKYIREDERTRINYSAKQAGVANYWKKMQGENNGIKKYNGIEKKQQLEKQFNEWVAKDKTRKENLGQLLENIENTYQKMKDAKLASIVFFEAGYAIETVRFCRNFDTLINYSLEDILNSDIIQTEIIALKNTIESYFNKTSMKIDKEIASTLLPYYYLLDKKYIPDIFLEIEKKYKGSVESYVDDVFDNSVFTNKTKLIKFLERYKPKHVRKIQKDPAMKLYKSIYDILLYKIYPVLDVYEPFLNDYYRIYIASLMKMEPEKRFYPDANGSLRISYGNVAGYYPADAIYYDYYTTTTGVIEKSKSDVYDYEIEDEVLSFFETADYERYAHSDNTMRPCFITTNHTTGGNSGSPVLNAEGHFIGINFDRVWEGTMSDMFFDDSFCRNISVDIRYILYITDKYANATHLINEMNIVE